MFQIKSRVVLLKAKEYFILYIYRDILSYPRINHTTKISYYSIRKPVNRFPIDKPIDL